MSESRIASSSAMSSGTFTSPTLAYGTRARSACRPWNEPLDRGPPKNAVPARGPLGFAVSHWAKYPARQYAQNPQAIVDGMITRSPSRRFRTARPISSTMPTPSWPRIVPGFIPGTVPRTRWRSVPQIALAVRRTIASVRSLIRGSGTSSSRMSPMPWKTTAFIPGPPVSSDFAPERARSLPRRAGRGGARQACWR